jgi:hypothetical protein
MQHLGFGNYRVFNGELFVNQELNNTDYVAGVFSPSFRLWISRRIRTIDFMTPL